MPYYVGGRRRRLIALAGRSRRGGDLVGFGSLSNLVTLTRAQLAGVESGATAADGATLALFGADVPRFNGASQRLLIEGQRTNGIRNPRAEGAVAGTPGTMPTNWSVSLPAGVSVEVVGAASRNGIRGVELRFLSASAAGGSIVVDPETPTGIAASPSQQWTSSVFAQLVAGTLAGTMGMFAVQTRRGSPIEAPLGVMEAEPGMVGRMVGA